MRISHVQRQTYETDIRIQLNLDGAGSYEINSGVPFFDHMLEAFSKHGLFDLTLTCKGDIHIDDHHTVEDIGIALGEAFLRALGDKAGIVRFSHAVLPMDEALVLASIDISGRPFLSYDIVFETPITGSFDACLFEEFLRGFVFAAGITLHIKQLDGTNTHHLLECAIKVLARALDAATRLDPRVEGIPSTKGIL